MSAAQHPLAVVQALDAACNADDLDGALALFAEDAVVQQVPAPLDGGEYRGRAQIRHWLEPQLIGFHADSHGHQVSGETVTWTAMVMAEMLRRAGLAEPVRAEVEAVVRDGKIAALTVMNNPEDVARFRVGVSPPA
jgi:ketosteroid isomerase-like protein